MLASLLSTIPISAISPAHEMAFPKVSYHFTESIPYDEEVRNQIALKVLEDMLVRQGPNIPVSIMPHEQFIEKAYQLGIGSPTTAAMWDGQGNINFSDRYYHKDNPDEFTRMLQHELGHALWLDHSKRGDSIMNRAPSIWSKVTKRDREAIRDKRGY